jgi:hypothetical protein
MYTIQWVGLNNLLAAYPDKSAYAMCIFTFCKGPGQPVHVFEGRCPVSSLTSNRYHIMLHFAIVRFSLLVIFTVMVMI